MKVPARILAILTEARTDGPHLYLDGPRFDAKTYQCVNDVLEGAGGHWDKAIGAHVFDCDAVTALAPVLASGQVVTLREARQQAQFFPTPAPVVTRLLELADVKPGMEALEPSAGRGAIAAALLERGAVVDCIEQDTDHAAILDGLAVRSVTTRDFLAVPSEPRYDRVVMNPPFTQQADIAHVTHALRFLKPDGLLVSVMSWAVTFQDGPAARFRALIEERGGRVEALPDGAFAESLTGVSTVIVTIPATRPADAVPVVWPVREMPGSGRGSAPRSGCDRRGDRRRPAEGSRNLRRARPRLGQAPRCEARRPGCCDPAAGQAAGPAVLRRPRRNRLASASCLGCERRADVRKSGEPIRQSSPDQRQMMRP